MIFVTNQNLSNLAALNEIKGGKWYLGTWISKPEQINLLFLLWLDPKTRITPTQNSGAITKSNKSPSGHKKTTFFRIFHLFFHISYLKFGKVGKGSSYSLWKGRPYITSVGNVTPTHGSHTHCQAHYCGPQTMFKVD